MQKKKQHALDRKRSKIIIAISLVLLTIGCYLLFYESTDIDSGVDIPFNNDVTVIIASLLIPISIFVAIATAVKEFYLTKEKRNKKKRVFFEIKKREI